MFTKIFEGTEKLSIQYGISTPEKPSINPVSAFDTEVVTDKYIFRQVFSGIQSFMPVITFAFSKTISPGIRNTFRNFLIEETGLYNDLVEYGMIKSWINVPPAFRV